MSDDSIVQKNIEVNISEGRQHAEIFKDRSLNIDKAFRRTSFQARLGKKLDNIVRKVADNNIRLASQPVDMIRVKANRDPISQDLISRTIDDAEIVPIIFPTMEDVPLRRLTRSGEDVLIPDLYQFHKDQYWEIYSPATIKLDEDDLLIRMIYDPYSDEPNIVCLAVKENLATIGYSSVIYLKYQVTLYDEALNDEIVDFIMNAYRKRMELGW